MSKIIKSSRIVGEYRLTDIKIEKERLKGEQPETKNKTDIDREEINPAEKKELLDKAHNKADDIIAEAEDKAEEIIDQARQQAEEEKEEIFNRAEQEGFESGHKQGIQQGLEQLQTTHQTLKQAVEKVRIELEKEKEKLPAEIIKLATSIAEKIINVQIDINPEFINNIISEMLLDIGDNQQKIEIRVNPEVMDYINQAEIASFNADYELEFTGDSSLAAGDCIVETTYGGKDGSLERKLKLLEKELYKGAGYHEGT